MRINGANIDEKAIIERVRALREQYAGKRGKTLFAKALGLSASTYSYYESDRVPPASVLWRMCEVTGADVGWLLGGEECQRGTGGGGLAPGSLEEKIGGLLERGPETRAALEAFVELLRVKVEQEKAVGAEAGEGGSGLVPVLGRTAAGLVHFWEAGDEFPGVTELSDLIRRHGEFVGRQVAAGEVVGERDGVDGGWLDEGQVKLVQVSQVQADGVCEFVQCKAIHERYADAFALRIDGDSMAPHILDGDVVVLSPSVSASDGGRAVIKLRGQIGVTCKILRREGSRVHVIPSNERYEVKVYDEKDIVWALGVLWRVRFS